MQVSENGVTGNTIITVDGADRALITKALWDEQVLYYGLLKDRRWTSPSQELLWDEKLRRLNSMALQLDAGVLTRFVSSPT